MMLRTIISLLLATFCVTRAEDGSAVVVVYNSKMPASKSLAEYYAEKRNVPSEQVIGLPLPETETISRADYRKQLVEPFLKKLEDAKIMTFAQRKWTNTANQTKESLLVESSKVRYAALCFGVPVKIEQDDSIDEPNPEKLPVLTLRNEAAVDSELSLLPMHHAKLSLNGPIGNRMYAATNRAMMHPTNGVLIVTRLDGPTAEISRGLIDKALQAEKEGLWGRAYFDLRGLTDGEYKKGDDMLRTCEKTAARIGFETTVDDQPTVFGPAFPLPQIGLYVGWYEHNVAGALGQPTLEFMPGAFAYHLHSWSAEFVRNSKERWVGPLLARGATCTMGSVYEPFLQGTPDISVFLGYWFFDGATFGEAAFAGQRVLSWQTTIIGDPLYRPMHRKPQQQHEALEKANSKLVEWSWLRVANINLATDAPPQQAIAFLRERPETKTSSILSEKLGDLLKAKGDWSGAAESYERALKLSPTPQQKLKITFAVAPLLNNLGRGRDAYALYQGILRDNPQYPDPLIIYRKLLPLASEHGKPGEAAEYSRLIKELTPKT
jgi:uncharacterized protein (TIGR03790 family)